MGTNYYVEIPGEEEELHLGKSSGGWCFALHVIPERGLNDLEDWKPLLKKGYITDEYQKRLTYEEVLSVITDRSFPDTPEECEKKLKESSAWYSSYKDFLKKNHAVLGPNNLVRAKVGPHCTKHGEGTWDCILGDFS